MESTQGIILWKRNTRGGGDLELGRGVVWIEPDVQRNVISWGLCLNHALQRDSQCGSNIKAMLRPWRAMLEQREAVLLEGMI